MSLDKKYNIPEETFKKMVRDGVISCSVARHYEIYDYYQQYKRSAQGSCKSAMDIYYSVAQEFRISEVMVRKIVYAIDKKT